MTAASSEIPFFQNPDDTHCFQACLKMIIEAHDPAQQFSWDELDRISGKQKDMWTWSMSGLLWLSRNNYQVTNVEDFDYRRFSDDGEAYLSKKWNPELVQAALKHSVIAEEVRVAKDFVSEVTTECRLPAYEELPQAIDDGNLLIVNINSAILNGRNGYTGHFILVTGYTESSLIAHDPGGSTPGVANRSISHEQFMSCWAYPDETMKNFMSIKPSRPAS